MRIFLKALFKSLIEKKARTILVLFSIAVAASLLFANESFSQVCEKKFYEADVRFGGNSDIQIETKKTAGAAEWIDISLLSKYESKFEYMYKFINQKALYSPSVEKMHYFTLIGADIDHFNAYNPITLESGSFEDWSGYKIIIGPSYSKHYGLSVNDVMKLEINGEQFEFKIVGVSDSKGLFVRELADGGFIIAPKATIAKIFGGQCNNIFIKLKDSSQKKATLDKFIKEFPQYQVSYGVNDEIIKQETSNYVMPFRISAIAVIFMSMFIIFTAFNLITLERIPLIGTLRSVGFTRKKINRLLLLESVLLGITGGILGCLLGTGVLQIILNIYFVNEKETLNVIAFLLSKATATAVSAALVITVVSSLFPILKITNTPIKRIILRDLNIKQSSKNRLWIIGLVFILLCVVIPRFLKLGFTQMIIANIAATGALLGMLPIIPFIARKISGLVSKMPFIRHEISLGVKNVHDNKGLLNNVQLFAAAIAIVAFMSCIFNSMSADLIKAWSRDAKYDIDLVLRNADEQTLTELSKVDGVRDSIGVYMASPDITNYNTFINNLYGIEGDKLFDFYSVEQIENNRAAIENLNSGRNIITTNILKDKLGLRKGDTLLLRFGSQEIPYKITGFVETNLGIGHLGYISKENFKSNTGTSYYNNIYIKTDSDAEKVKNNILRKFSKEVMSINTKKELEIANSDKVVPIFKAISVYSYIALLVGLIGIVNNLAVSFLERKRNFALLRSVGLSRRNLKRMLIAEALTMGVYGTVFGLACASIMSRTIPAIVGIFWGKVTVELPIFQMTVMGLISVIAMLAIAAVPVVESNKLSIMESIRYE